MKYYVQRNFYNDIHYVWCSESFDSSKLSPYSAAGLVPASSNPYDIYKILQKDVATSDRHSYKIVEQKTSMKKLAVESATKKIITDDMRDEILYIVDDSDLRDWRPLIYLIHKDAVDARKTVVPITRRAGLGPEYIISDLKGEEFQIIDLL